MLSNVTSETLTTMKGELQGWIREVVREVLHEEFRAWGRRERETGLFEVVAPPQGTLGDVLEHEFFGMWRERTDLPASPALARTLRAQAWERAI